jgi:hypothetical protein
MNDQPITLGELIDLLAARPTQDLVTIGETHTTALAVSSYRGYYDHLALEPVEGRDQTVGVLLAVLRAAVGTIYEGYKGGEFRMSRETPVWVSPWGYSTATAVTGIEAREGHTIITTAQCDEWAGGMLRAYRVLFGGLGFGNLHLP